MQAVEPDLTLHKEDEQARDAVLQSTIVDRSTLAFQEQDSTASRCTDTDVFSGTQLTSSTGQLLATPDIVSSPLYVRARVNCLSSAKFRQTHIFARDSLEHIRLARSTVHRTSMQHPKQDSITEDDSMPSSSCALESCQESSTRSDEDSSQLLFGWANHGFEFCDVKDVYFVSAKENWYRGSVRLLNGDLSTYTIMVNEEQKKQILQDLNGRASELKAEGDMLNMSQARARNFRSVSFQEPNSEVTDGSTGAGAYYTSTPSLDGASTKHTRVSDASFATTSSPLVDDRGLDTTASSSDVSLPSSPIGISNAIASLSLRKRSTSTASQLKFDLPAHPRHAATAVPSPTRLSTLPTFYELFPMPTQPASTAEQSANTPANASQQAGDSNATAESPRTHPRLNQIVGKAEELAGRVLHNATLVDKGLSRRRSSKEEPAAPK